MPIGYARGEETHTERARSQKHPDTRAVSQNRCKFTQSVVLQVEMRVGEHNVEWAEWGGMQREQGKAEKRR